MGARVASKLFIRLFHEKKKNPMLFKSNVERVSVSGFIPTDHPLSGY